MSSTMRAGNGRQIFSNFLPDRQTKRQRSFEKKTLKVMKPWQAWDIIGNNIMEKDPKHNLTSYPIK